MSIRRYVLGLAMLAAGAAHAQTAGVVTLRANQTSGTGSVTPVLTWSTNPVAASCQASGGWTGAKAASGTQTLPAITQSTNYTLTCSWGGSSAVLNWTAPSANTDGSALNDLAGFRVVYGTSSTTLDRTQLVNDVTARTTTVSSLTPGTWYFAVRALNSRSLESDNSNIAQKVVAAATAAGSVAITVGSTPPPTTPPPTTPPPETGLRTTHTTVYDVTDSDINVAVGTIALGRPCDQTFTVRNIYYRVNSTEVRFTRTPRTRAVVARCAR
jgi:hypothetical protein